MLYYNGFFHPKLKQMIERYTMLNNLRWDLLPMSLEYSRYLDTVKCSVRDLKNAGFSVGDFAYPPRLWHLLYKVAVPPSDQGLFGSVPLALKYMFGCRLHYIRYSYPPVP